MNGKLRPVPCYYCKCLPDVRSQASTVNGIVKYFSTAACLRCEIIQTGKTNNEAIAEWNHFMSKQTRRNK